MTGHAIVTPNNTIPKLDLSKATYTRVLFEVVSAKLLMILTVLGASELRSEWYVAAYLGAAHTEPSALDLTQPGTKLHFNDVSYQGRSFQSPVYYGYRVGHFFQRHFGVDVEFTHLKVYAEDNAPLNAVVNTFSISHGVNLLTADFIARQRLGRRFTLLGRAGYGVTIPHPEAAILGVHGEHYQVGRPVFQVSGGVEFRLSHGLSALGEYKFTRTNQKVDVPGGTIETLLHSQHVVAGLAWHF